MTKDTSQAATARSAAPDFNERENPLYRLFHRKDASGKSFLSEPQYAAGERLRVDYELANFESKMTASWTDAGGRASSRPYDAISDNSIAYLTDRAIDARNRVHAALDEVGPELAGILFFVCCLAGGLEHAERMLAMPQRSGRVVLAMALTRLARHYRLLKTPEKSRRASSIGHWALADYRPRIMQPASGVHQT
jgi:Domain of unknown function (DUF6456)